VALAAAEPGAWRGPVPEGSLRGGGAEIVLVSVPLRQWRHGAPDRRELGLPLVSVEFPEASQGPELAQTPGPARE
jgi:hypothetical protein